MYELVAIISGAGCGWLAAVRLGRRAGVAALTVAAVVIGGLVSWWSGELGREPLLWLWDASQALVAGLVVAASADRIRRRHGAPPPGHATDRGA